MIKIFLLGNNGVLPKTKVCPKSALCCIGQTSNGVKKYRKPYRIKKRKPILKNRFFWLAVLFLAGLGGIFYLVFFHSFFQIKTIEISGTATKNLEDLVKSKSSRQILFSPSRSIFLANLSEINREILEKFPYISKVNLKRKFPDTLILDVKEREAAAVFAQTNEYFLVDRDGIAFDFFDDEAKDKNLIKFKKADYKEITLRNEIITGEQLSGILEAESKLENELKLLSEEIMVVSGVRFDITTSEGFKIYFNFQEDLDWQITKLTAVLEEEFPPGKRGNLEYIDVRFGDFAVPVLINR